MRDPIKHLIITVLANIILLSTLKAQQPSEKISGEITRILFIMDASRSMAGNWQREEKFILARNLLFHELDSLKGMPGLDFALRVYGHQHHYPPQVCNDTRLEVPFGKDRPVERIKYRLKHVQPTGTSPIAASLAKASEDFTPCNHCRNIVILITDGKEECGGDICEVSAKLQKEGIILKPFIIGIGNDFKEQFDCAGTYFNAANKQQFSNALKLIITRALSKTSLQVNLLDEHGQPTETNVNMMFTDKLSERVKYNFVHTLNAKGVPDTLFINPLSEYRLTVSTLPPQTLDNVVLTEGKHNIVSLDCPQGILRVRLTGSIPMDFNPAIIIKQSGQNEVINVQYLNKKIKYIAGKYDIDILTLPPAHLKDFEIRASHENNIQIESPGILVVQKNIRIFGTIYRMEKGRQIFVTRLNPEQSNQESFYLQPGKYRLVYRSRFQNQSIFTVTKDFSINSLKTTRIRL